MLRRLLTEDPPTVARISQHARIIAFRNILAHSYADIDDQIVWGIELLGPSPGDPPTRARLEAFGAGLAAYRDRDFRAAEAAFSRLLAEDTEDGPAVRLYQARCRTFLATPPPADWDAVETLTVK